MRAMEKEEIKYWALIGEFEPGRFGEVAQSTATVLVLPKAS